jgi:hypothetical protein
MTQYFCYRCAISNNLISPVEADTLNLTGTSYQLGKYIKHTTPPTGSGFVTVFEDPTYDNYRNYIVTGTISGMLEIDNQGRKNLLWYGGEQTGFEYLDGKYIAPVSGIKIVLSEDDQYLHAYPVEGISGVILACVSCGAFLPQW